MNAEVLAEWHRRRGLNVLRTESTYWYEYGARVYQAFPFHWLIEPSADEIEEIFRRNRAAGLRFSAPMESESGVAGYHVVLAKPRYDLGDLPRQSRANVKKGRDFASVERVSFDHLAAEGWRLRYETLARQSRVTAESRDWWERLCVAAGELPGFEAWAALHQGEMVASLLAFTCDDCVSLLYLQSSTDHLRYRPNNVLFFEVTRTMVARAGVSMVFAGLHSLDAPASVDEFKFRMGYGPRLVREKVVFHPLLSPLLRKPALDIAVWMNVRRPGMPKVRKFEGLVRTALEGELPLRSQSLPDPVVRALADGGSGDPEDPAG